MMVTVMTDWSNAIYEINRADRIAVFTHTGADGDAISSAFSLAIELKKAGKDVSVILEEAINDKLKFLTHDEIKTYVIESNEVYDLSIAVDCGDLKRLGRRVDCFRKSPVTIKIDHHISEDDFGQLNYTDTNWSATCVACWGLIKALYGKVSDEACKRIYTGIFTDTGGFRFSNTNAEAHEIAAEIINQIGEMSEIGRMFSIKKISMIKLYTTALAKIEYFCNNKIVYLYLKKEDYENAGAEEEDGEGLSGYLRDIEGVDTSVVVKPGTNEGELKISMRSYQLCDVAQIASDFNGGGHKRAAGFTFAGSENELKPKIIEKLECAINDTERDS